MTQLPVTNMAWNLSGFAIIWFLSSQSMATFDSCSKILTRFGTVFEKAARVYRLHNCAR